MRKVFFYLIVVSLVVFSCSAPQHKVDRLAKVGAVKGKVTTPDLAKNMQLWAHMGHPCGENFIAANFFSLHPEFGWQSKYLHDMISYPWTLFSARK